MTTKNNIVTDTHVFFLSSYLSQWFPTRFVEEGRVYANAEQYMMAHKALLFGDEVSFVKIMNTNSPSDVKKLGRGIAGFVQEEWDKQKNTIVLKGNFLKFTQNPILMSFLLKDYGPNKRKFVECNEKDPVWGIGLSLYDEDIKDESKWKGENLLGLTLTGLAASITSIGFKYDDVPS